MMGNSAGGLTTAYSSIPETVESGSHLNYPSNVSFAVSMAGGISPKSKKRGHVSFIKDAGLPPYLGIHYTKDKAVPYDNAVHTQELLNDRHISNMLLTFKGKGHTPDLKGKGKFNEKLFDDVVGFALRHMKIPHCQLA